MPGVLHITSGDGAGAILRASGIPGEVFVWHDILYDGPRRPGWPDEETLHARSAFIEQATGGGLGRAMVLDTLRAQYAKLRTTAAFDATVLWFDACLFDQSMLVHILACLRQLDARNVDLLCVDAFPGVAPYHGLGQLTPDQMASVYPHRRPVTDESFRFAERADRAFALRDEAELRALAGEHAAAIPWIAAAAERWLQELPDAATGLGRLERLALDAVRAGCRAPRDIFAHAAAGDTPPQFWGDTTLWAKLNALADRVPPLVKIEGPLPRLPQWDGIADLARFRVFPAKPA